MHTVELSHRRIFILPTRRGLGLLGLIALLLLASAVYQNNLAYLLTFMLTGILLVSILHSFRALLGITLSTAEQDAVFAGDPVLFRIEVRNPSTYARHALTLALKKYPSVSADIVSLGHKKLAIRTMTQQRGWFEPGKLTASTVWPLGIFRAWSPQDMSLRVLVYPKPSKRLFPFPHSLSEHEQTGLQQHRGSEDFAGFQSYSPGDPVRHIHWKGVAKGQGVYLKQYSGGQSGDVCFDWQTTPGDTTENRLGVLCRWVLDAEKRGIRYGLHLPNQHLTANTGAIHHRQCLNALALFNL